MANTQTFSIKLTANGKEVKELMDALKKQADDYEKELAGINEQLKERDKLTKEEIKTLEKQADSLTAKIKGLNTAVEENITNLRKADDVLKNLAGSSGAELGKALRGIGQQFKSVSDQTLKAGETMEQKLTEIKEKMIEVRHEMAKREGVDAMKRAQASLAELANTPLDKLKMGLDSIEKKLSTMSETELKAADGMTLLQGRSQYKAQIAVTEFGRAGTADLSKMNEEQLRAEQQRLRSLYSATNGAKGFEIVSQDALNRLHAVNDALAEMRKNADAIDLSAVDFDNLDTAPLEKLDAMLKQIEKDEKTLTASDKQASEQMARNKRKVQEAIQRVKNQTIDLSNAQKVASNTGKYNVQQLQTAYDTLKQHLMSLNTGQTKEIAKTKKQMTELKNKIDEVTGSVKKQASTWDTAVKNITAYVGVFGAFNFVKNKLTQVFKANEELSDSLANVRKVSGLTNAEINQLYDNISKIDSRNSVKMLTEFAYQGGKLGIGEYGVKGMTGFVRAAEQVQMALGEELGEDALPALAKLTEVMNLIPKYGVEEAMQKASSAIFSLFTSSTATGRGIVEFSRRLMGLANVSRITVPELLALGSASEALGYQPEVASTAFGKLFTAIQQNHNIIEKDLGIPEGTIDGYYRAGKTIDAIVEVFHKMQERGNMNVLGDIFKDLGSEGQRLIGVMVSMADRVDILEKHIKTSNEAFKDGEAVIAEYMIQNQTAAAYMERAANAWTKAFTNPEGVEVVTDIAKKWHELSQELINNQTFMGQLKLSLEGVVAIIKVLLWMLPTLVSFLMFKGSLMAVGKLTTGFANLAKGIWAAVTASKALTAAQKWNAISTGIAIAATALMAFIAKSKEAAEAQERMRREQEELNKAFEESKENVTKFIKPLEDTKKALDKLNVSQQERDDMLRDLLKKDYQEYLDYLGIEIDEAVDLAKAYEAVVKVMKQKKAAQEKEDYRSLMNGDNKYNRIAAQQEVIKEAGRIGVTIDKDWLANYTGNNWESASVILKEIFSQYTGNYKERGWKKIHGGGYVHPDLEAAVRSYVESAQKEYEINEKVDEMFNTEYKDLDLENFNLEEYLDQVMQNQLKRQKGLESKKPDKDAEREAKKARQEAKQAMRKEMEDAQKESTGVLSKLEEWYRLQEAAITEARADGKMTEERAAQMVNALSIIKNESLATARRAITTGDTKAWDELKTKTMPQAMADASDLSKNLLGTIQNVPVQVLHDNLAKFNGDAEKVFGLDSRAFFDQINAKAAGNTREAARLRAKLFKQAEKLLEQYEVVRVAQKKMQTDLEGIGIMTETYEEFAYRMQNGITDKQPKKLKNGKTITDEEAYAQMGTKFIGQGTIPYRINIENADEALQWIKDFGTNAKGELEDFAQAFPMVEKMITLQQRQKELLEEQNKLKADGMDLAKEEKEELAQIPEKLAEAVPTIRAMFYQLEQSANNVANTIKKQVEAMTTYNPIGIDEMRSQRDQRVNLTEALFNEKISAANKAGEGQPVDENGNVAAAAELERQKQQAIFDIKEEYRQKEYEIREKMGATIFDQYENEVAMYKNMADKKLITEKQFQKKKGELQMKLGLNVAQQYNGMMSNMVNALQEAEIASVEAKYDAEINAAKANGQDTAALEEQKEAEVMEIRKKYAGMQFAVKISEIIANTAVAIMQAYAQLGPIGGSIAAAMLTVTGAAQLALAKAEYDKVMGMQASSSKSSATKTKAVSGMLTYDKGNVQRFIGKDGKVYTATEEPTPKDGLITRPIATTVQGQPALVAEKGPEIIIGRNTTKAIMMNEPELIKYLANYQQYGGRHLFDSGNVQSVAMPSQPTERGANAEREALIQRLDRSDELMVQVLYFLQNPVPPEIPMYDTGGKKGLRSKMKEADRFMARYGG